MENNNNLVFDFSYSDTLFLVLGNATVVMKTKVGSDHTPGTIYHIPAGKMGDGYMTVADNGCIPVLYQVTADINGRKNSRTYVAKWINMKQALPEKLSKRVSIVTTRQFPLH